MGNTDPSVYMLQSKSDGHIEVVGSSTDGLQVGKIFDIADVLLFSKHVSFDENDERIFIYSHDPSFPRTSDVRRKCLTNASGVYLNAHALRRMKLPFFNHLLKPGLVPIGYNATQYNIESSATKCAFTVHFPYSDSVADISERSDAARISSIRTWEAEHVVLTYLLNAQFGKEIEFVREILYSSDIRTDINLSELVRANYSAIKKDIWNNLFGTLDAVYFRTHSFQDLLNRCGIDRDDATVHTAIQCNLHGSLSSDYVPAIPCSGWPSTARNWTTRNRLWPSPNQVEEVVSLGYQLVAKSPFRNPDPEHDFPLSFSKNERKLSEFLPEGAKTAYRLLKHFYKCLTERFHEERKFKTFHLKTALFWTAEQTEPSQWETGSHIQNLRRIIKFLHDALEEGNLPGYFVPESNLIQHFNQAVVSEMHQVLKYIASKPATCVHIAIEKEWKLMELTTPRDSFAQASDPKY